MQYKNIYCNIQTIIIILIVSSVSILAQTWHTKIYSEKDGLPSSIVYSFKRDDKGALWVGHQKGLSRYDGTKWLHFNKENGLKSAVLAIEFYGNAVWCGTEKGLYVLKLDSSNSKLKFNFVKEFNTKKPVFNLLVWNDCLWANYTLNKSRLLNDKENMYLLRVRSDKGVFSLKKFDIRYKKGEKIVLTHSDSALWVVGEYIYKIPKDKAKNMKHLDDFLYSKDKNEFLLPFNCEIIGGDIFVATNLGLFKFNIITKTIKKIISGLSVIAKKYGENILISKPGVGIILLDLNTIAPVDTMKLTDGLSNSFLHGDLFVDFDGSIWVPTYCGLTHILSKKTRYYFKKHTIKAIAEFDSNIFIGYEGNMFEFKNNKIINNFIISKTLFSITDEVLPYKGKLWMTNGKNIYVLSKKRQIYKVNISNPNKINLLPPLRKFVFTPKGNILVAMARSFAYFKIEGNDISAQAFRTSSKIEFKLESIKVKSFAVKDSLILIGTNHGLFIFDENNMILKRPVNMSEKINQFNINDIKVVRDSVFLASEHGIKLIFNNKLVDFLPKISKYAMNCFLFYKDYLLLGSEDGLFILKNNRIIRKITEQNGLPHRFVNKLLIDKKNNLWVGTNSGTAKFVFNELVTLKGKPLVSVSLIMINNKTVYRDLVPHFSIKPINIELIQYKDRVNIYLTSNCVESNCDVEYYLVIENSDAKRVLKSKLPFFKIEDLPSGKTNVEIYAKLTDGRETDIIRIDIESPPPLYLTVKFILIEVFFIIIFAFALAYFRTRYVRKRNVILQQEIENRTAELKEINKKLEKKMEEVSELSRIRAVFINFFAHDISNAVGNMRRVIELLSRGYKLDTKITNQTLQYYIEMSLTRMISIIKKVLMVGRIETNKINVSYQLIDVIAVIEEEITRNKNYLEEKNIEVTFKSEQEQIIIRSDLELFKEIFENILNNAIKYSYKKGKIIILGAFKGNYVEIVVRDSGPGFPEDERNQLFKPFTQLSSKPTGGESSIGLGLWIVKSLLKLLNGDIIVKNYENGAEVIIRIPDEQ